MTTIISCFTNSYGRFGAQAAIENLRSAGLRYLELPIRTAGMPTFFGDEPLVTTDTSPRELEKISQRINDNGLRVSSCNVTSGNPLDSAVVAITKRKLDLARHFDVTLAVGNAGEVEDPAQLPTLYEHLTQIGDHAAELGMTYCFETHSGICCDHRGMLETMHALQHPHLKLNFDTGNILYYNRKIDGEVALAKVCHDVRHVHLKDTSGEYQDWNFPALGCGGAVNFVRVLEILRTCGFQGPYSLEIEGVTGEPELTLPQFQKRIADSVQYLRDIGYFDHVAD